jgi:hypothetical protein
MISLHSIADRVGPGHFRVRFSGDPTALELEGICAPSNWSVSEYDESLSSWEPSDADLLRVCRTDAGAYTLDLWFDSLEPEAYSIEYTGPPFIDASFNFTFFREYFRDHDPYVIEIEGLADNIPYIYLDQETAPSTVSQRLDMKEGVTQDSTADMVLVDIDGWITETFIPGSTAIRTALKTPLSRTETATMLCDSVVHLPASGVVYVNRETILYQSKNDVTGALQTLTRGAYGSKATPHINRSTVYKDAPNLVNRAVWIKDASGNVIYAGVIDKFSPRNLVTYDLKCVGSLALLDVPIGANMASGSLARYTYLARDTRGNGDTDFLINFGGTTDTLVQLRPGLYGITGLVNELNRAFFAALVPATAVLEDDKIVILLVSPIGFRTVALRPNESEAFKNSVLSRLGFPDEGIEENFSNRLPEIQKIKAPNKMFTGGITKYSVEVPLDPSYLNLDGIEQFEDGSWLRIDEEVMYSTQAVYADDVSTTLLGPIDASQTTLTLDNSTGFYDYDLIVIDDEIIRLGELDDVLSDRYLNCVRGVMGTVAAVHVDTTAVDRYPVPRLANVTRGMLGTEAKDHDGGTEVAEILVSQAIIAGTAVNIRPMPYFKLLFGDVDSLLPDRFSLYLPDSLVDYDSINARSDSDPIDLYGSFLSITDSETTYRDLMTRIARPINSFIGSNKDGEIGVYRLALLLNHQAADFDLTDTSIVKSVQHGAEWDELSRIQRVKVEMDRDAGTGNYKSVFFINYNRNVNKSFRNVDHQATMKIDDYHGAASAVMPGADFDTWAVLFSIDMAARYNRFTHRLIATVPMDDYSDVAIGDSIRVTLSNVMTGNGSFGASATYSVVEYKKNIDERTVYLVMIPQSEGRFAGWNFAAEVTGYSAGVVGVDLSDFMSASETADEWVKVGDTVLLKSRDGDGQYSPPYNKFLVTNVELVPGFPSLALITLDDYLSHGVIPAAFDILTSGVYTDAYASDSVMNLLCYIADADGNLDTDEGFTFAYISS